ncbi:MAG: hypothetical protein N2050_04430 [Flavobacteriales bacterium]|nr:hypothetical protein [Flavobacteriales bacterium]
MGRQILQSICRGLLTVFSLLFINTLSAPRGLGQSILWELSQQAPAFPLDPEFAGQRQWALALAEAGWKMKVSFRPPGAIQKSLEKEGKLGSVLLIFPSIFKDYNSKDFLALRRFVEMGGHLLWVAEHDNFFRHAESVNKFCDSYGLSVQDTGLKQPGSTAPEAGWLNAVRPGHPDERVRVYLPACLKIQPHPQVQVDSLLCWNAPFQSQPYLLAATVKKSQEKGRVSVVTDFEIFWNMSGGEGLPYGGNRRFLLDLLSAPGRSALAQPIKQPRKPLKFRRYLTVSREDSLLLNAFFGEMLRKKFWRGSSWSAAQGNPIITTTRLPDTASVGHFCLCGPNTRFAQSLALHAARLEARYPGLHVESKIRQMFERLALPWPWNDTIPRFPFLVTKVQMNQLGQEVVGLPGEIPYVAALLAPGSKNSGAFQLKKEVYLRPYPAPILPEEHALTDSTGFTPASRLTLFGFAGKDFFHGMGLLLADPVGTPLPARRPLMRHTLRALRSWYKLCKVFHEP